MPNFGEKLKQLRNYNGYTQEDLASTVSYTHLDVYKRQP